MYKYSAVYLLVQYITLHSKLEALSMLRTEASRNVNLIKTGSVLQKVERADLLFG